MKEGVRPTSPASAAEEPIVFVIDDDPLMLGGLSSLFRSIGLRVEAFASATELLQHPRPAVSSCLVLDIRLPRLGGFDLQAELNRLGIKIPIIFITGHGDVPMSVKAMKAGAIDFLTKPVQPPRSFLLRRSVLNFRWGSNSVCWEFCSSHLKEVPGSRDRRSLCWCPLWQRPARYQ